MREKSLALALITSGHNAFPRYSGAELGLIMLEGTKDGRHYRKNL